MKTNYHWGGDIINVNAKDLPSLKAQYIIKLLKNKENIKILEVGSGEGKILKTIHYFYPRLKLFGCDIKQPRTKGPYKFDLIKKNFLPYKTSSFDVILIVDCLEHVPHYKIYLEEINRIFKKNGIFHCFVPCEGELLSAYSFYKLIFGKDLFYKTKNHINAFKKKTLIHKIKKHFKLERINYSYHFLGHLMDATLFALTANKRMAELFWNENKYYNKKTTTLKGKILNKFLILGNLIAYYESKLLKNVSGGACAVHITCKKWK